MNKIDVIVQESEKAFSLDKVRAERLGETAEKLVGAVAVIVGFQLIDIDHLTLSGSWQQVVRGWLAIGSLAALGISLVLTLLSMQVQKYHSYPRGTTLIDELKGDDITDQVAKIKIARMYLSAHDINARINDKRAKLLSFSGAMLVTGFVLAVVSYLVAKLI